MEAGVEVDAAAEVAVLRSGGGLSPQEDHRVKQFQPALTTGHGKLRPSAPSASTHRAGAVARRPPLAQQVNRWCKRAARPLRRLRRRGLDSARRPAKGGAVVPGQIDLWSVR